MLEIEQLLRCTMGLTSESVGSPAIHRSVRERMALCDIQDVQEYCTLLHGNNGELQELIEQVVVPETSFFRHAEAFAALADIITTLGHGFSPNRTLRVLSAPCSTGEEAYSIAITLMEHGVQRDQLRIDAIDISRRAVSRAKHAVYSANSFRGEDLSFRDRYCRAVTGGYVVVDSVRDSVHFHHANLIGAELRLGEDPGPYDIIFCRNLLIYLDRPTQERVMQTLHRLLTPTGYLFVGPAETTLASECGFNATGHQMAFAFRNSPPDATFRNQKIPARQPRALTSAAAPRIASKTTLLPQLPLASSAVPRSKSAPPMPSTAHSIAPKQHSAQNDSDYEAALAQARLLADTGQLAEAANMCEALLRTRSTSVEVHYLLALVHDALGDTQQAAMQYRRVLFLAPGHRDAATHLALMARTQGDAAGAERLNSRAKRIEWRGK